MSQSVLALILAAGSARRFGEDKRWVILPAGKSMIEQVLAQIAAAPLLARVVLRVDDAHRNSHPWSVPTLAVAAEDAERGLGASLAAAARQLPDDQPVLICLADMPYIKPQTYRAVADALQLGVIAVPVFRGRRGNPVGFAAEYLPELRHLDGDQGGRQLLERHRERVVEVAVDDPGIHRDIDTVADLLVGL